MRLLIYAPSYQAIANELAAFGPSLEPVLLHDSGALSLNGADITPEAAAADMAWANGAVFDSGVGREFIVAVLKSPNLKWVQSAGAGFDHPIFAQIVGKGARLTTSHGQAVGMADYVISGVLDHFQRGPERRAAQAAGAWTRLPFREVLGTTWLMVGFGAVGQAVAARAGAFGAVIIGMRRDQTPHPLAQRLAPPEQLLAVAREADVVVLSVPLNPATRQIAGEGLFGAMKAGSVLVNVGRGALVDEPALLAALDRGTPAHAVLDVFATEPLPGDSRFWNHPSVSLTAHASGITGAQDLRNQALFLENLGRYLKDEPLLYEIDAAEVLAR